MKLSILNQYVVYYVNLEGRILIDQRKMISKKKISIYMAINFSIFLFI